MFNYTRIFVCVTLLALIAGSISPVASQSNSGAEDSEVRRRNNCRLAHQVLVHGQPANKREWAIGYSNNCGVRGGEALGAVLPQYRAVSVPGGAMEQLVQSASFLTDRSIFDAALALAGDRAAASAARVQAIRITYHQLNPATFQRYEAFVSDSWETNIVYVPSAGSEAPAVGTPLPPDALQQAERVLAAIEADPATPRPVQLAAAYLRGNVELKLAKARLCGAGVTSQECSRRLDEWEAQQDLPN